MNTDGIYDPNLSIALSASAGSGKTFALTTRLITMLLGGIGTMAAAWFKRRRSL